MKADSLTPDSVTRDGFSRDDFSRDGVSADRRAFLRSAGASGVAAALPGIASGVAAMLPTIAAAKTKSVSSAQSFPAAQAVIADLVKNGPLPGAMGSVGIKQSPQILSAGSIDFTRLAAPNEHTLWRIYSMTKPIVGMATMIAIEQGKLRLDTPLAEIIPAFAKPMVLVDPKNSLSAAPAKSAITIGQLLTHTSGMASFFQGSGPIMAEIDKVGLAARPRTRHEPAPANAITSLDDYMNRLASLPLTAEPGTQWSYSYGLDVMGRVLEIVEGKSFEAVLREKLFAPLGMNETFFQVPAARANDLAALYVMQDGKPVVFDSGPDSAYLDPPPYASGGGGLISSAHDYDRFLAMLANEGELDGVRVMKAETARLAMSDMLAPQIDRTRIIVPGCYGFGAAGALGGMGLSKDCFSWFGLGGTLGWVDKAKKVRGGFWVQYLMTSANIAPQPDFIRAVYKDLGA